MTTVTSLAILGTGNIGSAIASGLLTAGTVTPETLTLTRRDTERLEPFSRRGCTVTDDNRTAVRNADMVIVAVEPQQIDGVLSGIRGELSANRHILISVVAGVSLKEISKLIAGACPVVRAMPNLAIALGESITCLVADPGDKTALETVTGLFNSVGGTLHIKEEQMKAATALGACGIAFFLRAIRAASQGGIEIGFHADQALTIAARTAKGAAALLDACAQHPEMEIDKVTTPRGCTISGLNQMEHAGFSSAMIKGIVTSAARIMSLHSGRSQVEADSF
jgi:pyrroline-5-carboxylate reductase